MKYTLSYGIVTVLLAVASVVQAYPTLAGPTGLAFSPTATVVPAQQLQAAVDLNSTASDPILPLRVTYGIADQLEVGATYAPSNVTNLFGIHSKYIIGVPVQGVDFAVGAQYYQNDASATTSISNIYLTSNRLLLESDTGLTRLNACMGLDWTQVTAPANNLFGPTAIDGKAVRAFIGAEGYFDIGRGLTVAAEYKTQASAVGDQGAQSAIVARYPFTPTLTAQLGFTNSLLGVAAAEHHLFAGVNMMFESRK